jgi:hypothetical protein
VLELDGQAVMLQPYLSAGGTPPVDTAGEWHLTCLAADPVAEQWGQAHVRSFTEVRHFDRVATTPDWTVVSNPRTGDVLALGRLGAVLTLRGRTVRPEPGGLRMTDVDHWLEWDQPVIARIQAQLRTDARIGVLEVADILGSRHRLGQPDSLSDSAFRLNPELVEDWSPTAVGATVEYFVPLPAELVPYAAR